MDGIQGDIGGEGNGDVFADESDEIELIDARLCIRVLLFDIIIGDGRYWGNCLEIVSQDLQIVSASGVVS